MISIVYPIYKDLVQYSRIEQIMLSKTIKEVEAFAAASCQFVVVNESMFLVFKR